MNLKTFYDEQLSLLDKGDAEALVNAHYADDIVMIVNSGEAPVIAKGKNEVVNLFSYYLKNVYRGFVSTEKFIETDDSIFFEATIDTADGPLRVYDVLVVENGKVKRHYSGTKAS